jgi:hypothetical protein
MTKSAAPKTLTGITKIHVTPDSGRVNMTFSKQNIKKLKKMSIDLEIPLEDVISLSIDVLERKLDEMDIEHIDADETMNSLIAQYR